MRKVKWDAFLSGLCGFALALGVVAAGARADVTTEEGASILVFPKIQANGTFDTVIQITNTSNSILHAHCFYVDASLRSTLSGLPCSVPSATCLPIWQETDFLIWLTKQQPTHWLLSKGRNVDPTDGFASDGSGFDPGRVPPEPDFVGELKCIEVAESGEPVMGNFLKGEATLEVTATTADALPDEPGTQEGDVSKYNAIGIRANPDATPSNPLTLDDSVYNSCPAKLIVNHFATGSTDPVAEELGSALSGSSVATQLTLVPCSEDFENQRPKSVTVQFLIYNQFEERFSASTTVTCFLSVELTDIDSPGAPTRSAFSINQLGTEVAHTEITPVVNLDGTTGGLLGVVERIVSVSTATGGTVAARAAYDLHTAGNLVDVVPEGTPPDEIVLPLLE
ncbi:MAG TPA: hypothetical protein VMW56_29225 [Candidatus Margulisiibacteriota bacterium]|nr:hypothetical protein [Candidatus Margulisiibacteriota bacterium]